MGQLQAARVPAPGLHPESFSEYMSIMLAKVSVGAVDRASGLGRALLRTYRDGRRPHFHQACRVGAALATLGLDTNEFESAWFAGYRRECIVIVGIYAASRSSIEHGSLWSATILDTVARGEWPAPLESLKPAIRAFRDGYQSPASRWLALSTSPDLSCAERWGLV